MLLISFISSALWSLKALRFSNSLPERFSLCKRCTFLSAFFFKIFLFFKLFRERKKFIMIFFFSPLILLSHHSLPSIPFFKFCLGNDFSRSADHCCLKTYTDVVDHDEQDGSSEVVSSVRASVSGQIDLDKLQWCPHNVYLTSLPAPDLAVVKSAVINSQEYFSITYPHEFYCTSMYAVPETFEGVSTYGFSGGSLWIWKPLARRAVRRNRRGHTI